MTRAFPYQDRQSEVLKCAVLEKLSISKLDRMAILLLKTSMYEYYSLIREMKSSIMAFGCIYL